MQPHECQTAKLMLFAFDCKRPHSTSAWLTVLGLQKSRNIDIGTSNKTCILWHPAVCLEALPGAALALNPHLSQSQVTHMQPECCRTCQVSKNNCSLHTWWQNAQANISLQLRTMTCTYLAHHELESVWILLWLSGPWLTQSQPVCVTGTSSNVITRSRRSALPNVTLVPYRT